MELTNKNFIEGAKFLGIEVPVLKAIAQVEGNGIGMLNAKPIILFEPHIFWKLLKQSGVQPVISDISYPVWGTRRYPSGQEAQWQQLDRASKINRPAALKSASWGLFQILGMNFRATGRPTLQQFVNDMFKGEDKHLEMFLHYIKNVGLDDELKNKDWKGFSRQYNGLYYYKNAYNIKLEKAYKYFISN